MNSTYYLIVLDSCTKWPEVFRCYRPTSKTAIKFFYELFEEYGVPDTLVSDNRTQFSRYGFKNFCKRHVIKHIFTPPHHLRSNGQVERFVDTFKRALRKVNELSDDEALSNFLRIYRVTPNPSTNSGKSPTKLMFTRRIKSIFDKLLPEKKRRKGNMKELTKYIEISDKVHFKTYRNGKEGWEDGFVTRKIGSTSN
ncbi:uncharacterized protein K02A2.6-like [Octopus sinensis]|uniref:Uncharacterized protein K02A2.6-like n=1 Tax=Octopus sinensis TaxID=2607531 RepID=A0A6P7T1J5_9MOLL|nr:uncharacterized protein K02A2.6-like [Octopus sinensis]